MIKTEDVKIPIIEHLTSDYIEKYLYNLNYDVLRWAITNITSDAYIVSVSFVKTI